jgi:dihydroneopterin aldolase
MNSLFKIVTSSQSTPFLKRTPSDDIIPMNKTEYVEQSIHIEGLELEMFIGVFDNEKQAKQKVLVSAKIDVTPNANWQDDNVNNVVSYADIIDEIKKISNRGHIGLVETFANQIIETCFKHSQSIIKVSVKLDKPDIIDGTASVGCSITKSKK